VLTQDQIEFYRENGYLHVRNVVDPADIEELRRVTDEFVERSRAVDKSDNVFDLEPGHTSESPKLRRLKEPASQHAIYEKLLRYERVLDVVSQLIGPALHSNGTKLNMKLAEFGSPVEWHQDWAFYPHTNDDILAVGVPLDDMTAQNGCLLVIPGSHKGPTLDHHQNGMFVGAVTDPSFDDSSAVRVEANAGDISIHHVRALHGSLPNTSGKPRRLLLQQYCAGDAWPLTSIPKWDEFVASHVRGEPSCTPRLSAAPVRLPLPPSSRGGSIYETQTLLETTTFGQQAAEASSG
jgi:ectoine hydroxylase-related dioxygenase (phytanoyl-CoA dioxygenase family)